MAIPFQPLTTEKLEVFFKKMIKVNCTVQDSNRCHEQSTGKLPRNKLMCPARILKTWRQKERNL
jgi:hypothetical protein